MKISLILIAAMSAIGDKSGDVPSVANGINAFAFDLYGKLRMEDGNLFFSPYSISTALAMKDAFSPRADFSGMTGNRL